MNIAFSTIVLFILLLPGLIYRRLYYTEEFSKEYIKQNFYELFLSSFVPSLVFHAAWFYLVRIFGYKVDLVILGQLFALRESAPDPFKNIQDHTGAIILYNASIFLVSGTCGFLMKELIRLKRWDVRRKLFRFQNSWHYLFSGEYFDFPKTAIELTEDNVEDIELVYVDALVETQEGTMIYDGILVNYELSQNGGLDHILLKMTQRRYLRDDPDNNLHDDSKYYNIPGHSVVIQYSKVINMNLTFYKLVALDEKTFIPEQVK